MKRLLFILFFILLSSEAFSQQGEPSVAFVHVTKVEKAPFSEDCTERSPLCTAAVIEKFLLRNIAHLEAFPKVEAGKIEVPVRVIVDAAGRVSWASVKGLPEEVVKVLVERLMEMPVFIPGEHQGEKANVIVDLKVPLYFSEAGYLSSEVISNEEADQQPVWNKCRKKKDPKTCTSDSVRDWMNRKVNTSVIKDLGSFNITAAFVVDEQGNVNRVVVNGDNDQFATEVIKQLKDLPQFVPGKEAGEPVATSFLLKMSFRRS